LVLKADQYMSSGSQSGPSSVHMVLEVHPALGEPFRTELKVWQQGLGRARFFATPMVGESIPVEVDAKSQKVRVVVDEAHDERAIKKRDKAAEQALVDAPIGSGGPPATQLPGGIDPQQLENLLKEQLGIEGDVVMNFDSIDIAPGGAPPAATGGMLDQLEQLGQLRAQGVLTEEEFQAQKAKLLAGG
jgi:hypothetical protein